MRGSCVFFISWLLSIALGSIQAHACDICAIYNAMENTQSSEGSWYSGVFHRFTHYESNVKPAGRDDLPGQHLESNITQLFAGIDATEDLSLQLTVPLIYRKYRRVENGVIDESSESGLGDLVLLSRYDVIRQQKEDRFILFGFSGGLKLPTGDSDRLAEERSADHRGFFRHGNAATGSQVGGDDLALGSGSYDFLLGAEGFYQESRMFFRAAVQYFFRTEGDFDYQYGNDLHWNAGPGYFFALDHDYTLDMRLKLSGEHKDADLLKSQTIGESDDSRLFVGPDINLTFGQGWSANFGADFAFETESSSKGVVPKYRLLATVSHRFN